MPKDRCSLSFGDYTMVLLKHRMPCLAQRFGESHGVCALRLPESVSAGERYLSWRLGFAQYL